MLIAFLAATKRAIVVDAGSSGTRLSFYQWESSESFPAVSPMDGTDPLYTLGHVLSDAASDASVVRSICDSLIKTAADKLSPTQYSSTDILFYGTAGMRLPPQADQDRVVAAVFYCLRRNAPFIVRRENIRVIAGYEEGIFGWVSAALLLGSLPSASPSPIVFSEIGGASMQLAFEVDAASRASDVHRVRIIDRTYAIFAHSYLGYGIDQAFRAVTDSIGNATAHPCLTRGLSYNASGRQYVGAGDANECLRLIEDTLLNKSAFSGVAVPVMPFLPLFVGVSVYAAVVADLGFPERLTMDEFLNRSLAFADLSWDDANARYPGVEWLNVSFFDLFYAYAVVVNGFLIEPDIPCYFPSEINGTLVRYSLGAVACKIWDVSIDDKGSIPMWVSIVVDAALILLLIPVLVLYLRPRDRERVPDGLLWVV
jgi:Golgi nucleoside diphosphatase